MQRRLRVRLCQANKQRASLQLWVFLGLLPSLTLGWRCAAVAPAELVVPSPTPTPPPLSLPRYLSDCAAGFGSALGGDVDPSVANGWPSCMNAPCTVCTRCPLGTSGEGGIIAPASVSGAAVCGGTGTSVPGNGFYDPATGSFKDCPAPL